MTFRLGLARLGVVLAIAAPAAVVPSAAGAVVPLAATPRQSVSFNNTVQAIGFAGNTAFVGGQFTAGWQDNRTVQRDYLAAVDVTTGQLTAWAPTVNGPVTTIAVAGHEVYLGGSFTTVDGQPHRHLAALDASTGALAPHFWDTVSSPPEALAAGFGRLYVGGDFNTADNQPAAHLVAFALAGGLDGGFTPKLDGDVHALALGADRVYVGGVFHHVDGSGAHPRLAAVAAGSGALDSGFAGGAPVIVRGLAAGPQGVYAGLSGSGGRLYGYDLAGRHDWSVQTDGDFESVAVMGDTVYGGGHFDHACSTPRVGVKGVCLDGSTPRGKLLATDLAGHLQPWSPGGDSIRGAMALVADPAHGMLAAGGDFIHFNGTLQQRFAIFGP